MGKRLSEVASLEIINIYNGDKYGYFGDCEIVFNKKTGKIDKILVSQGKSSIFSFKEGDFLEIPWDKRDKRLKGGTKTLLFDFTV
ncbi:YlmC/YmxH family sporulation protein [Fonticella tunisiensis]|uniref:YlmC/YmxH family sporulation protein n=1 Tax=Fonticella tunisiensis TaxID=1096341 RepID=A0A4R7KR04_9CLOT|nr:YlmC/YmxH family sporulation protein [Fonticella tunisiensis]TDT61556.1 YlmC/YmxH family sporulation protein [Fonticella tunisiensis]